MDYPVILLGAGGHAKVLLDMLTEQNSEVIGVTVGNPDTDEKFFCDIPIIGGDEKILDYNPENIRLVNGVGSIGSTALRKKIYEKFKNLGYKFRSVIHTSAIVSEKVTFREVQVMAGAVINAGSVIEENSIINTGALIDHDCRIGKHVHIAPGVVMSGGVHIGMGSHIGVGSTIIQGVSIGENCIIGAGSLVLKDIEDNKLAYGVPAVIQKDLGGFK